MLKKSIAAIACLLLAVNVASARVDVNKADQVALDGIKGLGPTTSKTILAERHKAGTFRDWADFERRVPGIGEKRAARLSQAGLTVNGKSKPAPK